MLGFMFGSAILEVAVGVIFVYLLLSLLCSALGELIESFIRLRASDLEKGIGKLLDHPKLAKEFFKHPLIKSLGKKPSYIPARTFSLALWNLATAGAAKEKQVAAGVTQDLETIKGSIASLDDEKYGNIKVSLLTLIEEAGNDLNRARANIEEWYNDAMDRVSGGYRRRMQWMMVATGFITAAFLNIDTINMARTLWYNDMLRSSVAVAAENYIKAAPAPAATPPAGQAPASRMIDAAASNSIPIPVSSPLPAAAPDNETALPKQAGDVQNPQNALKKINDIRGEIDRLGIPFGWVSAPRTTDKKYQGLKEPELFELYHRDLEVYRTDPRRAPQNFNDWLLKVLGILLTGLAVSQGAPFWFDLLNKFIVIRSTVKPREKSPEQPSKEQLGRQEKEEGKR